MGTWLVLMIAVLSTQDVDHGVFCHKGLVAARDGSEAQQLMLTEITEDGASPRTFTIYGALYLHDVDLRDPVILVSGQGEGQDYCSFRSDPDAEQAGSPRG